MEGLKYRLFIHDPLSKKKLTAISKIFKYYAGQTKHIHRLGLAQSSPALNLWTRTPWNVLVPFPGSHYSSFNRKKSNDSKTYLKVHNRLSASIPVCWTATQFTVAGFC